MATNLLHFRPSLIGACASGCQKSDLASRKSSSANWWTPLFGMSSEPDYIDSKCKSDSRTKADIRSESNADQKHPRSRFAPGCFTEEKAKQLRIMTNGTDSFHDVMYHSAIASRLASDFKHSSDLWVPSAASHGWSSTCSFYLIIFFFFLFVYINNVDLFIKNKKNKNCECCLGKRWIRIVINGLDRGGT